jgi:hypothetical protein
MSIPKLLSVQHIADNTALSGSASNAHAAIKSNQTISLIIVNV